MEKKGLLSQYTALGFSNAGKTAVTVGICEIVAAFLLLIRPYRPLVLAFLIWKITSEFFYPHYEIFEWIERGGSYGVLLALWFALDPDTSFRFRDPTSYRSKLFMIYKHPEKKMIKG
jgi:hypothetical protein